MVGLVNKMSTASGLRQAFFFPIPNDCISIVSSMKQDSSKLRIAAKNRITCRFPLVPMPFDLINLLLPQSFVSRKFVETDSTCRFVAAYSNTTLHHDLTKPYAQQQSIFLWY